MTFGKLQNSHGMFGLGARSSVGLGFAQFMTLLAGPLFTTQETGAVDTRRAHNVYVHANELSNQNVIGVAGSRTCICQIPVISMMGDVLYQSHSGHVYDFVDVSNRTFSVLSFELRDCQGEQLDLRGGTLSLEILFTNRHVLILKEMVLILSRSSYHTFTDRS